MSKINIEIHTGFTSPWASEFNQDTITIGRAEGADVRLHPTKDDACTRGIHARLQRSDGAWELLVEHDTGVKIVDEDGRVLKSLNVGDRIAVTEELFFELGNNGPRLSAAPLDAAGLPVTDRREHGGKVPLPVGRVRGDVITKANRAPRLIAGTIVLVLIVGVALSIWSLAIRGESREGVDQARTAADLLVARLADLDEQTRREFQYLHGEFSSIQERSEQELSELRQQVAALDDEVRNSLQQRLRDLSESVFAVGVVDDEGTFTHAGTAWLAGWHDDGRALLATNAHVAVPLGNIGSPHLRLVARSGTKQSDFEIAVHAIHSGYNQWRDLVGGRFVWTSDFFQPLRTTGACDVALLIADFTAESGLEPLQIAVDEDAAYHGGVVGYVGYPSEGVILHAGLAPPVHEVGILTRATDFFGRAAGPGIIDVYEMTLTIAGGASGSPMFDRHGRVIGVVNAGSMLGTHGGRISMGLNYAHHVRFVSELLTGDASSSQAARYSEWQTMVTDMHFLDEKDRPEMIDRVLPVLREQLRDQDIRIASVQRELDHELKFGTSHEDRRQEVPVSVHPAVYLAIIASHSCTAQIRLQAQGSVRRQVADLGNTEWAVEWRDGINYYYPCISFILFFSHESATRMLRATVQDGEGDYLLHVYRVELES